MEDNNIQNENKVEEKMSYGFYTKVKKDNYTNLELTVLKNPITRRSDLRKYLKILIDDIFEEPKEEISLRQKPYAFLNVLKQIKSKGNIAKEETLEYPIGLMIKNTNHFIEVMKAEVKDDADYKNNKNFINSADYKDIFKSLLLLVFNNKFHEIVKLSIKPKESKENKIKGEN